MSFVPVKGLDKNGPPAHKREVGTTLSWNWADIEEILSAEWEIGGSAMTADAVRGVWQKNKKTSEGI